MAPVAGGPSLKSAPIAVGRLESSYQRTGSPLSTKAASNTVLAASTQTRTTPQKRRHDFQPDRDSDSSLSDFEGADSDAETERLHISPQKRRPSVMVQHTSSGSATETMTLEIPVAKEVPTKPTVEDAVADHAPRSAPNTPTRSPIKKRKREEISPAPQVLSSENPESDKPTNLPPPKKKVFSPDTQREPESPETSKSTSEKEGTNGDLCLLKGPNGITDRPVIEPTIKKDPVEAAMDDLQPDEDAEDEDGDQPPSAPTEEETGESVDVTQDDDEGAEAELTKQKAIEELAEIEKIFAKLKDHIYNDKLHRVEIEMKMLTEGTHPELLAQRKCIDERLDEKVRLANAQFRHAMESLNTSTRVNRAQVHSQYFQQTRQLREDALYNCNELWYAIQRERRAVESIVPEYTFRISDRRSTQIKQRMQYNWEVQILGGLQKHVGFPAAPDVNGATDDERAEDLEALGITSRRAGPTVGLMRMEDLGQHTWGTHAGPPKSPAIHSASSQHLQPPASSAPGAASTHVHIHHHHRPGRHVNLAENRRVPPPTPDASTIFGHPMQGRRLPTSGPPPQATTSLSQLLAESTAKLDPPPLSATQMPLAPFKSSDAFAAFPTGLPQQHRPRAQYTSLGLQIPGTLRPDPNASHPAPGRRGPAPTERANTREPELGGTKRRKEDISQVADRKGGGGGDGLRNSLYRSGSGVGYS